MNRREILSRTAAIGAFGIVPLNAFAKSTTIPFRRVRPGDADWPSDAVWAALNTEVGGNLIKVEPLLKPCLGDPKSADCAAFKKDVLNPFYLGDQPAGTQVTGWLGAWMPAASIYAIRARTAADVAAGINFARTHRLRLVVKGTGHSYQGTSNAPDSLLIWTRGMNSVALHDAFVPRGMEGKAAPCPAVTADAGCMWIDLYHAVTSDGGRYVQGGGCADVGVAGLIQSGGFGSFSKGFGTAASHLLEAEIVTADGVVRTVNAGSEPDLFWAIKGGGGGSWGVITRLTLRTHKLPEKMGSAWGKMRARSDAAYRILIDRFFNHYAANLFNPHWGEQVTFAPDNSLEISMCCQGLDSAAAKAAWASFFDWVKASPNIEIVEPLGAGVTDARHWWDVAGNDSMTPDPRPGAPAWHGWWNGDQGQVSSFLHAYSSLWLPQSLLTANGRPNLVEAIYSASRHKHFSLHFNKGLAGATAEAIAASRDTATNPDVRAAFALAIIADGEGPVFPTVGRNPDVVKGYEDVQIVKLAVTELRKAAPSAGSYVSESDYFLADWQRSFWGGNYKRLMSVKSKYDPTGLFFVHHGVGTEGWSRDGFEKSEGGKT